MVYYGICPCDHLLPPFQNSKKYGIFAETFRQRLSSISISCVAVTCSAPVPLQIGLGLAHGDSEVTAGPALLTAD